MSSARTKPAPVGFHCPACGKRTMHVKDTRPEHGGIRRRRECSACGNRVWTVERIAGGRK